MLHNEKTHHLNDSATNISDITMSPTSPTNGVPWKSNSIGLNSKLAVLGLLWIIKANCSLQTGFLHCLQPIGQSKNNSTNDLFHAFCIFTCVTGTSINTNDVSSITWAATFSTFAAIFKTLKHFGTTFIFTFSCKVYITVKLK